jgi:pyruvate dehydrogenase E1 component alpha subunit
MDVVAVAEAARSAAQMIRQGGGPVFLEFLSQRFSSHSTTARETRSAAELVEIKTRCPIQREIARLRASGLIDTPREDALQKEAEASVAEALAYAEASPYPIPTEALTDVG